MDVSRLLRRQPVQTWRKLAGAAAAPCVPAMFFPRDPLSGSSYLSIGVRRILMPYAAVYWPQRTRLAVQEPATGWRVPRGEPLVVRARINGEVPAVQVSVEGVKELTLSAEPTDDLDQADVANWGAARLLR
ncbi:MAG: hypothetical protein FJ291_34365 [Planctomycetes bacterium]|nr:hypothetical protein [Planctomycetota bacterium]